MAIDLGGIARGLGAAGVGYLGGEVAGEKEKYRREQIAANETLKRDALAQQKELVGLRRKELDPKKDVRAMAARDAAHIADILDDPSKQDDINHMPGFRQHLTERYHRAQGVVNGTIDPSDYIHLEDEFPHVTGKAPQQEVPAQPPDLGGAPTLGPITGPPRVPQPAPAFHPPLTFPRFGEVPPEVLANEVLQDFPGSPRVLPAPGPTPKTAPAGATSGVVAPKPEFDPRAALRQLAQTDPLEGVERGPTEAAAAFEKRKAGLERAWNNKLTRLTALIQAEPRADLAKIKVGNEPSEHQNRLDVGGASAFANTQRGLTDQASRPVKIEKGKADIGLTKTRTTAIPKELDLRGRSVAVQERNATSNEKRVGISQGQLDLARERLRSDRAYKSKLIKKGQAVLDRMPLTEAYKDRRAQLAAGIGILKGQESIGSLRSFAGADQVPAAAASVQGLLEQMGQGAPTNVSPPAGAAAPTPALKAPANEKLTGPAITKAEISSVGAAKKHYASDPAGYKAWVGAMTPNQQKRVRFAERLLPRR